MSVEHSYKGRLCVPMQVCVCACAHKHVCDLILNIEMWTS